MKTDARMPDTRMDSAALYREEVFTDRKVGTLRRLTPVKSDGSPDASRPAVYVGEAQLMTSAGGLPLSFEIDAQTLEEAAGKYGAAVKEAFEAAMAEIQELRRRASSSLIIPEAGAASALGGGLPGALPGGKLKLP
ncbi:MAG: hypothetical protein PHF00_03835 [Elusimicrobia bacterium]|nr:hypothetical protein [Elusimicrobiota bacterium]